MVFAIESASEPAVVVESLLLLGGGGAVAGSKFYMTRKEHFGAYSSKLTAYLATQSEPLWAYFVNILDIYLDLAD